MAWTTIKNAVTLLVSNPDWEYDDSPVDPGVGHPERPLWLKQTSGTRTNSDGTQVYTKCRMIGTTVDTSGELSKSYWDNK